MVSVLPITARPVSMWDVSNVYFFFFLKGSLHFLSFGCSHPNSVFTMVFREVSSVKHYID